jgi:uncharacterized protein (DUF1810 family)
MKYNLQRFIAAQDQVYTEVLDELRNGGKRGHWMWYIFPQITGLGQSVMAKKYAITSLQEAKACLAHPLLGSRLRECTGLVLNVSGRRAEQIFDYPDTLKFRSSMTLFSEATIGNNIFHDALLKYFEGKPDQSTLDILARSRG